MTSYEEAKMRWEEIQGKMWEAGLRKEAMALDALVLDEEDNLWANSTSVEYFLETLGVKNDQ